MTMTDPTLAAIPPRIAKFPDLKLLPAPVRPSVTEYLKTYDTLDRLAADYVRLTSADARREAAEADALAQAGAIRQGKTASSIGRPMTDALEADALAAETELVGALTALRLVTDDMRAAFVEVWADDAINGRAAAQAAIDEYRQAIAAVAVARAKAVQSLTLPTFIEIIGHRYAQGATTGPTVPFVPPNLNYGASGIRISPEDHLNPSMFDHQLNKMADVIAAAIPNP